VIDYSILETLDDWPASINGEELANEISQEVLSKIVLSDARYADAVTLWVMSTWLMELWQIHPFFYALSPTKRCGKTTMLTVVKAHVKRELTTSTCSEAALFRVMSIEPTLIMDEFDRWGKNNEHLNGIINGGHNRETARVIRMEKEKGGQFDIAWFPTFGAKAFASIGKPLSTLLDRSLIIPLSRKLTHQKVEPLPLNYVQSKQPIRRKLQRFAADNKEALSSIIYNVPVFDNDRAAQNWEPLLRIASILSADWEQRALQAYQLTSKEEENDLDDEPDSLKLLKDLSYVILEINDEVISSSKMISMLIQLDDSTWRNFNGRTPIDGRQIKRLLNEFKISRHRKSGNSFYQISDIKRALEPYRDTLK